MRPAVKGVVSVRLTTRQRQLLKYARLDQGLSQVAMAREVGCSKRTIIRMELGQAFPSPQILEGICRCLGFNCHIDIHVRLTRC